MHDDKNEEIKTYMRHIALMKQGNTCTYVEYRFYHWKL